VNWVISFLKFKEKRKEKRQPFRQKKTAYNHLRAEPLGRV